MNFRPHSIESHKPVGNSDSQCLEELQHKTLKQQGDTTEKPQALGLMERVFSFKYNYYTMIIMVIAIAILHGI